MFERPRVGEDVGLEEALELGDDEELDELEEEGRTPDRPRPYSTALATHSTT